MKQPRPWITKQQIERMIFNTVYNPDHVADVSPHDRPDFVLTAYGPRQSKFGVEITEVFEDESEARLQNIDGYFDDLMEGKPHRHRDDIDALKVETVQIMTRGAEGLDEPVSVRAIVRQVTGHPSLAALLAQRIQDKDARAANYKPGLTHVNLVINDRTHRVLSPPALGDDYPVTTYLSADLRAALSGSRFHEVHLVSQDSKGNETVRGLRTLMMVEAAYVFLEAVKATVGAPHECSDEDSHLLFIAACERQGFTLHYVDDESGVHAQFGSVGVQFTDSGIKLFDGYYRAPQTPTDRPASTLDPELTEQIVGKYVEFAETGSFSCAYGVAPVRTFKQSREELGITEAAEKMEC
ncbi:hypothetical protein MSTE_00742 [Mycobacteroides stephanolepidis]|uniref:Uncharacterized protein n=1 Tax=[Mycobacterium] stephanolepidis TaxID=1520670 RepID=A0A1Z4ESZ8_9MYCO|nr:hypothetical protein [[Mycobacterium] stephanolepidis]BAX96077.1 hypothetical protein MSTE_00742 [[Mycobacterium] stephanolepidis]